MNLQLSKAPSYTGKFRNQNDTKDRRYTQKSQENLSFHLLIYRLGVNTEGRQDCEQIDKTLNLYPSIE